jgi:hypothetical protein
MAIGPTAGSKLYIGTSESIASPDDYLEIGEITDLGSFGRVYTQIKAQTIGTRGDRKYKGTYDDGTLAVKVLRTSSDTGQAAALVARDSDSDYNFKLVLNDAAEGGFATNTTVYFKAKVMSYTLETGGPNTVVAATINLDLKSGSTVEVAAA